MYDLQVFDENQNLYFNDTLMYFNLTDPLVQANVSDVRDF